MTAADEFNLAGILVTGAGSSLAMFGVYQQMNGYFAFRSRDFVKQMYLVTKTLVQEGPPAARDQIDRSARMGEVKGENRGTSLIGFYCVFFGFLLQMIGSGLLLLALFHGASPAGACEGGKQ